MKKLLAVVAAVFAAVFAFTGCGSKGGEISVIMPDGAPALALSKLISSAEAGESDGEKYAIDSVTFEKYKVKYSLAAESSLGANLAAKKADVAIMPTNTAASAYNGGADIKIVSINVHGLLYMLGAETVTDLNQLKGQVVYSIGQGGTPDFVFKYILDNAGIEYVVSETAVDGKVAISYVEGGSNLIPMLKQGKAKYGILGEPAVSNAVKATGKAVVLDLQAEWKKATKAKTGTELELPQACLVVSGELIKEHKDFVDDFIAAVETSDEWLPANAEAAGEALKKLGSATAASTVFTPEIIGRCNIKTVKAAQAKAGVDEYLSALYGFAPAAVGGKLPDDGLFYNA